MLFMVIESFEPENLAPIAERFNRCGRMLPDGVLYHASWIERTGARCYQLMEAPDRKALERWTQAWSDLVDFAIDEVVLAADFWRDLSG